MVFALLAGVSNAGALAAFYRAGATGNLSAPAAVVLLVAS